MPCLIQEAPRPFALILCLTLVNSSESADVELVALEVEAVKSGAGRPSVICIFYILVLLVDIITS